MTRIAVASGKGGTGKTLVATSLAQVAAELAPVALIDADVEAANAGLLLRANYHARREVEMLVPVVDQDRCTHCGRCAEVCAFSAMASPISSSPSARAIVPAWPAWITPMRCGTSLMAPAGQFSAQLPHPWHISTKTSVRSGREAMALKAHTSAQRPQCVQRS